MNFDPNPYFFCFAENPVAWSDLSRRSQNPTTSAKNTEDCTTEQAGNEYAQWIQVPPVATRDFFAKWYGIFSIFPRDGDIYF